MCPQDYENKEGKIEAELASAEEPAQATELIPEKKQFTRENMFPFILTGIVIFLDQIIKSFIVAKWPNPGTLIKDLFNNEFLVIYHVRNKAIAFSIGENLPQNLRYVVFIAAPIVVLIFLLWYYFNNDEFSKLQRWAIGGIIGGGIGNILDRIFRSEGVVDFISVKFYGFLGMERWPTFNVADSSVVICCIILLITMISIKKDNPKKENPAEDNFESETVVTEEVQDE